MRRCRWRRGHPRETTAASSSRNPGNAALNSNSAIVAAIAKRMFDTGPARPTSAGSRRWLRRFRVTNGTGFAQPMIGAPITASMSGKITVPKGSMCLIGLSVMRPSQRAVGSPSFSAAHPCADSCTESARAKARS